MEIRPVRLRLSRARGFDLQAVSRAYNGRDAVNVARPGRWGNPFSVTNKVAPGAAVAGARGYFAVPTVEDAIACFREMMLAPDLLEDARTNLRGKNLACWCAHGEPCHADVLLELLAEAEPDQNAAD